MTNFPLVLALDSAGNPHRWITHEDVAYYQCKDLVSWEQGFKDYDLRGGISRISGEQSRLSVNTIVAIKGKMMSGKQFTRYNTVPLTNKALFRRDHNICAYCGNTFSNSDLTRDHVIPTSRGGLNQWDNVVSSCSSCNRRKDDFLLHEIDMKLRYTPYAPCRAEYLIFMNKNILDDQLDFLLNRVNKNSRIHQHYEEAIT